MPVHDWTRVEAGIFHAMHLAWLSNLQTALNNGLLPPGYYALAEQHAGSYVADLLTLHGSPEGESPLIPPSTAGLALAEAPPRVSRRAQLTPSYRLRRRTLAIRHVSGHRLVAVLEIVSPANKDRAKHVHELVAKVGGLLECGVHALLIDLLPPGPHDPKGIHGAILEWCDFHAAFDIPVGQPLTLASYEAGPSVEAFWEHVAVGQLLPDMPLVFQSGRYINAPLEATYTSAYAGVPGFWRELLERP